MSEAARPSSGLRAAWAACLAAVVASRIWNALEAHVMRGFDAYGHVSYVLFLDLYHAIPYADQGWSYFHPPLHYLLAFPLTWAGDAEVLLRGMALLSSAASVGVALVSAWVVRMALPERPFLALLAFVAVALLPVHVYTSTMPGNEQTAAFLGTLGVALFLRNQLRREPTRAGDAGAGLVLGLALLAKFSALLPLLTVLGTLGVLAWRERGRGASARALARGALLAGVALLVCAPFYARNIATFGTPLRLSRDTDVVSRVESQQPPGERGWRDLVSLSPKALVQPDPQAPHLLHSIWGSAYVNAWSDSRSRRFFAPRQNDRRVLVLALGPTALALAGLGLCARRALRGNSPIDLALVALTAANLGAFAVMAYRVPTFAMLKASYLLQLSLPYGLFLARALVALGRRLGPVALGVAAVWIGAVGALSLVANSPGLAGPSGRENARIAAVHLHFGDVEAAREVAERTLGVVLAPDRRLWLQEVLGGVALLSGDAATARELYARVRQAEPGESPVLEPPSVWRPNRLAVATALAGDGPAALRQLDALLARDRAPELLASRAALRGQAGDAAGAEADLREALEAAPALAPAWRSLAALLEARADRAGAADARARAERFARAAPRGFPYGVGDGYHVGAQRFVLELDGDGLRLYRPARARGPRPQ